MYGTSSSRSGMAARLASASMYSTSPANIKLIAASRNQYAGTRSCSGSKAMRSVTTTMKIDMEG